MQELRSRETSALVELLAAQTKKYSRMLSEGSSEEEFAKCSLTIRAIQSEIEFRKRMSANTSTTDSNIILPE
jgi:hypothetical protein